MKKPPQTLNGVIRERLEDIERRLAFGVRQEVILEELRSQGYETTTIDTLRNALWRARKWRERQSVVVPSVESPNTPARTQNPTTPQAKSPENPLKKSAGFLYKGSKAANKDDLV